MDAIEKVLVGKIQQITTGFPEYSQASRLARYSIQWDGLFFMMMFLIGIGGLDASIAAAQEQRIGLVIGSTRSSEPEIHAMEDALTFGETLREMGYSITNTNTQFAERDDFRCDAVLDESKRLAERAAEDTEVLIFSLHGLGLLGYVNETSTPCFCLDSKVVSSRDSAEQKSESLIPIKTLLEQLSCSAARGKILVLDITCEDENSCLQFQSAISQLLKSNKCFDNTVVLSNCVPLSVRTKVPETQFMQQLKRAIQGSFEIDDGTHQAGEIVSLTEVQAYLRALAAQGNETLNWKSLQSLGRSAVDVSVSRTPGVPVAAGIETVHIPAGRFRRGSRMYLCPTEQPVTVITIARPFFVSKYELTITQALQWLNDPDVVFDKNWLQVEDAYCPIQYAGGAFVRNPKYESSSVPVFDLTWEGAVAFCDWCNSQDKEFSYRLPTEAEWEYVARAGSLTEFPFGDSCNGSEANVDGSQPFGTVSKGPHRSNVLKVGSFAPNAWGLFDTVGNVSEWCQDDYDLDFYKTSPTRDPFSDHGIARLRRGGSFSRPAIEARSSFRNAEVRHLLYLGDGIGVRIVAVCRRSSTVGQN